MGHLCTRAKCGQHIAPKLSIKAWRDQLAGRFAGNEVRLHEAYSASQQTHLGNPEAQRFERALHQVMRQRPQLQPERAGAHHAATGISRSACVLPRGAPRLLSCPCEQGIADAALMLLLG